MRNIGCGKKTTGVSKAASFPLIAEYWISVPFLMNGIISCCIHESKFGSLNKKLRSLLEKQITIEGRIISSKLPKIGRQAAISLSLI
jgi:hypothetical protein